MRTNTFPKIRMSATSLGFAALALLAACAEPTVGMGDAGTSTTQAPEPIPVSLPADAVEAGLSAVQLSPDEVAVAIFRDRALEIANAEIPGAGDTGVEIEAYLVRLTDPSSGIADRAVWLIRYSGLSLPVFGPPLPDGADPGTMGYAYVYIDAITGEFLLTYAHS